VKNLLDMSVLAFVPTIFLGILGGLFGALFVSLNIKINKLRERFFSSVKKTSLQKNKQALGICAVSCLWCAPLRTLQLKNSSEIISPFEREISEYSCPSGTSWMGPDEVKYSSQTFNEAAALLAENGRDHKRCTVLATCDAGCHVAKMIDDWCNMSLYSSLLKLKGIPYLDSEPLASHRKKRS
ncbi:unnamed protein product, partial [Eretmochelys imbricata]